MPMNQRWPLAMLRRPRQPPHGGFASPAETRPRALEIPVGHAGDKGNTSEALAPSWKRQAAFLVLSHLRRKVLHFDVVECPSSAGTVHQLREAFPVASPPCTCFATATAFTVRSFSAAATECRPGRMGCWYAPGAAGCVSANHNAASWKGECQGPINMKEN